MTLAETAARDLATDVSQTGAKRPHRRHLLQFLALTALPASIVLLLATGFVVAFRGAGGP